MKTALLLILCLTFGAQAQTTQTITIDWSFNSTPSASGNANTNRTIEVEDTVEWNWYSGGFHNVVSNGGTETFNSGSTTNTPGVNFSFTFNQVGSTNFICQPHSDTMFGTITVVAEGALGVDNLAIEKFSIFPNPATSKIELKTPNNVSVKNISIYNVLGQEVYLSKKNISVINISNLKNGVYFLRINSEYSSTSKRFIKL